MDYIKWTTRRQHIFPSRSSPEGLSSGLETANCTKGQRVCQEIRWCSTKAQMGSSGLKESWGLVPQLKGGKKIRAVNSSNPQLLLCACTKLVSSVDPLMGVVPTVPHGCRQACSGSHDPHTVLCQARTSGRSSDLKSCGFLCDVAKHMAPSTSV